MTQRTTAPFGILHNRDIMRANLTNMPALMVAVGVSLISFVADAASDSRVNDNLIPTTGFISESYQRVLIRKLFVTAAEYGRIVELPSTNEGETSIAIHAVAGGTANGVFVTCTTATQPLWTPPVDTGGGNEIAARIAVRRVDVPISKVTAIAVSHAITRMLQESRPPVKTDEVILHGTDYEFAVDSAKTSIRYGLLTEYGRGPKSKRLRALSRLLFRFCHAPIEERVRLTSAIDKAAAQLIR
jgi:hypothetical protein